MKLVKASEFKADCERVIDRAAETGEVAIVVKNGKPKAVLAQAKRRRPFYFGMDKGRIQILGDIVSPHPEEWEVTPRAVSKR